jgi:hypothetical protein
VPSRHHVVVAVPFSVEEIENLSAVAKAQGACLVELIRARVFGPSNDTSESFAGDDDDLTSMVARIEGMRIRGRGRGPE